MPPLFHADQCFNKPDFHNLSGGDFEWVRFKKIFTKDLEE